uniref:RING-type E3 ubiquitin transferase n=1 Tax=Strigops habroptila TaxID=2489341 RepID=A0A672UM61_STRHB
MEQWHRVAREQEPEPDVPCTICMNGITDAAYVDGCLHSFCFGCIRRWAARRAVCPLCRSHVLANPGKVSRIEQAIG